MGWARAAGMVGLTFVLVGGGSAAAGRYPDAPHHEVRAAPVPGSPPHRSLPPGPAPTSPGPACQQGVDATVSVADASAPGGRRTVWVHRPAGPDRADIPVLYVLHGYPGGPGELAEGTLPHLLDAQMCRTGRPFVVALPDGRAGDTDTEWGDDARGTFHIESFVTQQAVALVEGAKRRPATLRAIAGFSMGGYGAAALAMRHPDEYRQVASFSGYFRMDDPDGVFGRQTATHAPDQLIDSAAGQRFFLVEGTDEDTPLQVGGIHGEADRFAALLRARNVTVSVAHPPGGHSDDAWDSEYGPMVDFLDSGWTA
jgi:S-formylglutathione hydrolase FrmB